MRVYENIYDTTGVKIMIQNDYVSLRRKILGFFLLILSPFLIANTVFSEAWREGKTTFLSYEGVPGKLYGYIMNADGSDVTKLIEHQIVTRIYALSPDCKKVAFGYSKDDTIYNIYTMDIDGGNFIKLTDSKSYRPRWSPDGAKIVYCVYHPDDAIYIMNADGTKQRKIGKGSRPDWSPDGRRIVFYNDGDICTMDVNGRALKKVTNGQLPFGPNSPHHLRWSPDGEKIVFGYEKHIYTIDVDGNNLKKIEPPVDDSCSSPCWSPNGQKIAFITDAPSGWSKIFVMNPDGSNPEMLTNNDRGEYSMDWRSPSTSSIKATSLLTTSWGKIKMQP